MFASVARKIFGSKNAREVKKLTKVVKDINILEESVSKLDEAGFKAKTSELKERLVKGETLDQLLPEGFALVREAGKRTLGMRHFDMQLVGGMTLHNGKISEMRTGEGKTLVATLAVYLNALTDKGVHLVTVNDYLASRDAEWMRPLYEYVGLTVGVVVSGQDHDAKKEAYEKDITYGTNNEFGFDYLRDNMAFNLEEKVQRGHYFAIVDEVDSILIDEARTPLIISGPAEDSSEVYRKINKLIPLLQRGEPEEEGQPPTTGHFVIDEKGRSVDLTEAGHSYIEDLLVQRELLEEGDSLYAASNLSLLHHVSSGLRAHHLYNRNIDYIVQNGQVVIVDEHTGRTMPGRRWGEGLHQAVEAKEGVRIQAESQTLASTTFQNYFRLYEKLAGMTGTADTEAFEFRQIYGLDVVVIPTNKDVKRIDYNDLVYLSVEEKFQAVIDDIKDTVAQNRPVLVGTASIEASEYLASLMKKKGIKHSVLNAKQHEREAHIIALAGTPGTVTIATNMAGRGTDIVLGGNWEQEVRNLENPSQDQIDQIKVNWEKRHELVVNSGGLHVIGSERHESRRIDNQLRGRSGRQGDPGSTRFYLSLEDSLMRIFASDRVKNIMQALGMEKGEAIEHRMVSNAIEKAQRKVEGRNFDIRKSLLEYDDVANDQRRVIYEQRNDVMARDDIVDMVKSIRMDVLQSTVNAYIPPQSLAEQWDVAGLETHLATEMGSKLPLQAWLDEDVSLHEETLREKIADVIVKAYPDKQLLVGEETMHKFEKQVFLQVLDALWKEHLSNMDILRMGIHLRGYAQKNPKQEYKREAFELFQTMLESVKHDVVRILCNVRVQAEEEIEEMERLRREAMAKQLEKASAEHPAATGEQEEEAKQALEESAPAPFVRDGRKIGRNEPCPCGSGKKYKQCHGKVV